MVTCKHCGEEFDTKPLLMSHAKTCENKPPKAEKADGPLVIPANKCPEEIKYLSPGMIVGFRIIGRVTEDGVAVEEIYFTR